MITCPELYAKNSQLKQETPVTRVNVKKRSEKQMKSPIYFVGAGPGDPELITIKGKKLLKKADIVIYAGSLINPAILQEVKGELFDSAFLNLDQIIELMKDGYEAGKVVVRLHSGDPSIYGAILEQMECLNELSIPYTIIPGVSSAFGVAARLGIEYTVPEVSQTLIITRLSGRTPVPKKESLDSLSMHEASMLIFLSIKKIEKVVEELKKGYPIDTPVAVIEKVSWPEEKIIIGTLKDIAQKVKDAGITKTAIIAVSKALSDRVEGKRSMLYNPSFSHGLRNAIETDNKKGKLFVIGTGPGYVDYIVPHALDAIRYSQVIIGYKGYLKHIDSLLIGKEVISSGMREEMDRCNRAVEEALLGKRVALISGGDPGIYAMAGPILQLISRKFDTGNLPFDLEIIPGIPALNATASRLGAPLMHDFASISLSDLLTPWEVIEERLKKAAMADYVIVLYNPRSKRRRIGIERARDIIMKYRAPDTPVGIVKNAMRNGEDIFLTTLDKMLEYPIDMFTTVIIGNTQTFVWNNYMITPRGYKLE